MASIPYGEMKTLLFGWAVLLDLQGLNLLQIDEKKIQPVKQNSKFHQHSKKMYTPVRHVEREQKHASV